MANDIAKGNVTDYQKLLEFIRSSDPWVPSELTALVCLERHLAARLALISAEVDTIVAVLEDALKLKTYKNPVECAKLNHQASRLMAKTGKSLEHAYIDSMTFLQNSGVEEYLR